MARKRRRPRPSSGVLEGAIVVANKNFVARVSADAPLLSNTPNSFLIEEGVEGILVGKAHGAPEFRVVDFEIDTGKFTKVEVFPEDIEILDKPS